MFPDPARHLHIRHDGAVLRVELNRPAVHNALDGALVAELTACLAAVTADDGVRALLLAGTGPSFCAGGDLKEMAELALEVPPPDFLPIFGRNVEVEKPTIAAVNGVAFAGGFLLAQMCDLCIAADHARFGITEAKVGRGAPWAMPLPWLVPPRVALELLLTGDPINATRAFEVGLVNRVVPGDQLHDAVQELAETIAANAPLSVRAAKQMVYRAAVGRSEDEFAIADAIWEPVYRSEDAQEGPRAFGERRPPQWKGR